MNDPKFIRDMAIGFAASLIILAAITALSLVVFA